MEKIFFTILDPITQNETRLNIDYSKPGDNVTLQVENGEILTVDPQQLMELGALFLALAGTNVDCESADALLDGFGLEGKAEAQNLANALWE